jgi:outer membrane protein OmpA-like peptidoglycan-associated protein
VGWVDLPTPISLSQMNIKNFLFTLCWLSLGQLPLINAAQAAPERQNTPINQPHLKIIVNSDRDTITPDDGLTLREAIALTNGELTLAQLSPQERVQVQDLDTNSGSKIEFKLPAGRTKIALTSELPAIQMPGVSIDGTTQSGFIPTSKTKTSVILPTPAIEITPAEHVSIARGISIFADDVTIKGLSIYGFSLSQNHSTQDVPSGDIFISHGLQPNLLPPNNVTIESNFLGIKPDSPQERLSQRTSPLMTSDFGVYVFNSKGTTIRHNVIKNHNASGIITAAKADNLLIQENILIGNGTARMPDAIRLEGEIRHNKIDTNLICANDGSAVYLFKPAAGAVEIRNNTIEFNGRRLRRAAIHLMGNDNRVVDNKISNQAGSGVVVSAFPQTGGTNNIASARNIINSNRFAFLEGLSIDLNTYRNDAVEDFQDGDGVNPQRNSNNRRLDTGNMAINAPQFRSRDFLFLDHRVNVDGTADPGTKIELYQVGDSLSSNGSLSRALTTVTTDANGHFGATLTGLQPGESISAIATDPQYGTSEPARNAIVILPGVAPSKPVRSNLTAPQCLSGSFAIPSIANADPEAPVTIQPATPPAAPVPPIQPPVLPAKIQLKIPANIHFALDKSNITPISGAVVSQIAKVLKDYPYIVIDLEGHTDPRANNDYNRRLGLRRATATRDYLVSQGIESARITIRSYGETRLKSPRSNILDYARDRRVEFFYRDVRGIELEVIEQENDLQLERRK